MPVGTWLEPARHQGGCRHLHPAAWDKASVVSLDEVGLIEENQLPKLDGSIEYPCFFQNGFATRSARVFQGDAAKIQDRAERQTLVCSNADRPETSKDLHEECNVFRLARKLSITARRQTSVCLCQPFLLELTAYSL